MHMEGKRLIIFFKLFLFFLDKLFAEYCLSLSLFARICLHSTYEPPKPFLCQRFGFSLDPSPQTTTEATFTPDGQYVVAGRKVSHFLPMIDPEITCSGPLHTGSNYCFTRCP